MIRTASIAKWISTWTDKMLKRQSFLLAIFLLAFVPKATSVSLDNKQLRTLLYSSTLGTYYIVLNTTFLVLGVLILGGLALAYLFASSFLSKLTENSSDYNQSYYPSSYYYYQRSLKLKGNDNGKKINLLLYIY